MSNGKGDKYRPVNQHMYDKGWARMIQQCVECVHNKGDQPSQKIGME